MSLVPLWLVGGLNETTKRNELKGKLPLLHPQTKDLRHLATHVDEMKQTVSYVPHDNTAAVDMIAALNGRVVLHRKTSESLALVVA